MPIISRAPYWTAEEDRQLRILWEAGWSTLTIGITIGRGKNAVCGRRKRLGLPERENPIHQALCPAEVHRIRREMIAGNDAYREAIVRAA